MGEKEKLSLGVIFRGLFKKVGKMLPVLLTLLSLGVTSYVFYLNQQLSADVARTLIQAEQLYEEAKMLQAEASRQGNISAVEDGGAFSVPEGPRVFDMTTTPYSIETDIYDWMLLNFESKGFEVEIVTYLQYEGVFFVAVAGQVEGDGAELWIVPYVWDATTEDYVRGQPWLYFDSEMAAEFTEQSDD